MDGDPDRSFGALVRARRVQRGWSQEALAARVGVATQTISRIERDERRAYSNTVLRLAEALFGAAEADEKAAFLAAAEVARATVQRQPVSATAKSPASTDPASSSRDGWRGARPQLPVAPNPLIGREEDLTALLNALGERRLVTMLGVGGGGKSRLALAAISQVRDRFADGVWLVDLTPLQPGSAEVVPIVAAVFGVYGASEHLLGTLTTALGGRQLLLVLDNCEHVAASCAHLVDTLLRRCPAVRVLTTSRVPLRIMGEREWPIPLLALPPEDFDPGDPETLLDFAAIRLLVVRAQERRPTFTLTAANARALATLSRLLDGIPLALELAGARLKSLEPELLLLRLGDRFGVLTQGPTTAPPHQRSLRATLDWSHGLLPLTAQILLRRLAVFAGGWTLDAAEGICVDETLPAPTILDALAALQDHSLVSHSGGGRYEMLETVREYSIERLVEVDEMATIRGRHAAWYGDLARRHEHATIGEGTEAAAGQRAALTLLDREIHNLRAALAWFATDDIGGGLRLANHLGRYWQVRGLQDEAIRTFDRLLVAPPNDAREYGIALLNAGRLSWLHGRIRRAQRYLERSLRFLDPQRDRRHRATVAHALGQVVEALGDFDGALAIWATTLASDRAGRDASSVGLTLGFYGATLMHRGRYADAEACFVEGLAILRVIGDPFRLGWSLLRHGALLLAHHDFTRAEAAIGEAEALFRSLDDTLGQGWALVQRGLLAYWAGADYHHADALLARGLGMMDQHGTYLAPARFLGMMARAAWRFGDYRRAYELARRGLSLVRDMPYMVSFAEYLETLALFAVDQKQYTEATRALGAADRLRAQLGMPRPPAAEREYNALVQDIARALSPADRASATNWGLAHSRAAIIEHALSWVTSMPDQPQ